MHHPIYKSQRITRYIRVIVVLVLLVSCCALGDTLLALMIGTEAALEFVLRWQTMQFAVLAAACMTISLSALILYGQQQAWKNRTVLLLGALLLFSVIVLGISIYLRTDLLR